MKENLDEKETTRKIKISPVTEEEWELCDKFNKKIIEDFLKQSHLSPASVKQYRSAGRIFARWVYEECDNLPFHRLRARHGARYQDWLDSLDLSPSIIRFRRSFVSSLSNYIELYYGEDYEGFRNIFSKATPQIPKTRVKEKIPLTLKEYNKLINTLKRREETQMLLYVMLTYSTGARVSEIEQLRKEIANVDEMVDVQTGEKLGYYQTHPVRAKGRTRRGEVRPLEFGEDVMKMIHKWLEERGEDGCPNLFVRIYKDGRVKPMDDKAFQYWCKTTFSDIVGRSIFPHLFRTTRATHLTVYEGQDIQVAQNLLGHKSSSTTEIYVVDPNAGSVVKGAFGAKKK